MNVYRKQIFNLIVFGWITNNVMKYISAMVNKSILNSVLFLQIYHVT